METNPLLLPIGAILVSTVTGGGLWFVVRLVIRYQRDFTNRYSNKLHEYEAHIEVIEDEKRELTRRLIACRTERGALRATMRQAGIAWNPQDYGAIADGSE